MNDTKTVGAIVAEAFKNSKNNISFVLKGAFEKHGNTETATGSHFCKPDWYTKQEGVEHYLFFDMKDMWKATQLGNNILIAEAQIPEGDAVTAAVALTELPTEQLCKVKALGHHPTLVTMGIPKTTTVVTAIVELDGGKDPDLVGMDLEGKPVLVTWHPGKALEPSHPTDCNVGDILTVKDALKKGWKVAALEATWDTLDLIN